MVLSSAVCIICNNADSIPIIFNNSCKCHTIVHPMCYNWYLKHNRNECPICKKIVTPLAINDSPDTSCSSLSLLCFLY